MKLMQPINLERNFSYKTVLLMIASLTYIWAHSSYGKVTGGEFVQGMPKTLGFFASKNPYGFVADFLNNTAMPNANLFGQLTMLGELAIAIALIVSVVALLFVKNAPKLMAFVLLAGLLCGTFLNVVFWFAAGWTSPSTASVNMLMILLSVVGVVFATRLLKS